MKTTGACPKCRSRKLFVIEKFRYRDDDRLRPLSVIAGNLPTGKHGFLELETETIFAGTFQVWVCSECGFTEWYATKGMDLLMHLAENDTSGVRFVDGGEKQDPYR